MYTTGFLVTLLSLRVVIEFPPPQRVCKRCLENRFGGVGGRRGDGEAPLVKVAPSLHSRAELHPETSAYEHDLAACEE